MTDININKLSEALNTKADIDLNNTGVFTTSGGGGVNLTSSTPTDASGKEVTSADFIQSNLLNYTTNRILEIPQNIKYTFADGTLTIKAGTKVYSPNGFESDGTTRKFDIKVLTKDYTYTNSFEGTYTDILVSYENFADTFWHDVATSSLCSGETDRLAGKKEHDWYDTKNNIIYHYIGTSTEPAGTCSLPILQMENLGNNGFTKVANVFNGFGFIGSHAFALPGVKVQIPDGRNENGTCKVKEISTTAVTTNTYSLSINKINWYISNIGKVSYYGSDYIKLTENNLWVSTDGNNYIAEGTVFATSTVTSGTISNWEPYNVDSVANSNASNFSAAGRSYLSSLGMPSNNYINLTLGASESTYTAPANGWLTLSKQTGSSNQYIRFESTNNLGITSRCSQSGSGISILYPCKLGDVVTVLFTASGTTNYFRFVYAQGVE